MSAPAGTRRCENCACHDVIRRPAVQPPDMTNEQWDRMPEAQSVCRLNPPIPAQSAKGLIVMHMPTSPAMVCWQWKAEGTRPGESFTPWSDNGSGNP